MNMQQAFDHWTAFLDAPQDAKPAREGVCCDCGAFQLVHQNMWLCPVCATLDDNCPVIPDLEDPAYRRRQKSLYMRRCYFLERLNLLCAYKTCAHPDYKPALARIKRHRFKSIPQLRRVMKKVGANKFYKFIYCIWHELKKERLITLGPQQIGTLSSEFVLLESLFKQSRDAHGRKNLFSYSAILFMLLKRHKIKGARHVLLPHHSKTVIKCITKHCHSPT